MTQSITSTRNGDRLNDRMDARAYNRQAWDRQIEKGNRWTRPVDREAIARARTGDVQILL